MSAEPVSASVSLKKIADWDGNSRDIHQVLVAAFEASDYKSCVKDLRAQNIEPMSYINNLDKIIDSLPDESKLRKLCIKALSGACGLCEILPSSYSVKFALENPSIRPFSRTKFAVLWRLTSEENPDQVFAVRSLAVYADANVKRVRKEFYREVVLRKRVKHPNVLSIEGAAPALFEFCTVSQWMTNGNMLEYVTEYPQVNRLELLIGVVRGLNYLHNNEIVHGNLKDSNILVDAKGNPRLTDFGFRSIMRNITNASTSPPEDYATVQYLAPELVDGMKPTRESDVYSLSMAIVVLVTGKIPYPELRDSHVIVKVLRGGRPQKPPLFETRGMSPAVWKIAKACWHQNSKNRLDTKAILQSLENLPNPDGKRRGESPPKSPENIVGPGTADNDHQQPLPPKSLETVANPNNDNLKPSLLQRWGKVFDRWARPRRKAGPDPRT